MYLTTQHLFPGETWLLDWHVYSAGATDFVTRDLYRVPLESPYRLPIDAFNYPPLSAIMVLPLLALPDAVGGGIFVVVNVLAMAGTTVLTAKILGARQPWLWGGIGFLAYTIHPWMRLAFLGNNTPLVLLLVAAFAHQHLQGSGRRAGLLLGAAIALKLWPLALFPLLLRERKWETLGWSSLVAAAVALVTVGWLGLDVLRPAWEMMQVRAIIEPNNPVFFVSWLRETQPWWPWWGGFLVAALLAAIPARGRLGIALGTLGGLALVPNLWRTYVPALIFAGLLAGADLLKWLRRAREERLASERHRIDPVPDEAIGYEATGHELHKTCTDLAMVAHWSHHDSTDDRRPRRVRKGEWLHPLRGRGVVRDRAPSVVL